MLEGSSAALAPLAHTSRASLLPLGQARYRARQKELREQQEAQHETLSADLERERSANQVLQRSVNVQEALLGTRDTAQTILERAQARARGCSCGARRRPACVPARASLLTRPLLACLAQKEDPGPKAQAAAAAESIAFSQTLTIEQKSTALLSLFHSKALPRVAGWGEPLPPGVMSDCASHYTNTIALTVTQKSELAKRMEGEAAVRAGVCGGGCRACLQRAPCPGLCCTTRCEPIAD